MSSVEMSGPVLSSTVAATSGGNASNAGSLAMLGVFSSRVARASSVSIGAMNIISLTGMCAGSVIGWYVSPPSRGSVITPVSAEAAAVSGLHR
jgi:hypothetical protein